VLIRGLFDRLAGADVPPWMPDLLLSSMSMHASSPPPVSTTVKSCLASFKKTHQDSWVEDSSASSESRCADREGASLTGVDYLTDKFSPEQQAALNDLLIGESYYA
jgi:hypothetical protein